MFKTKNLKTANSYISELGYILKDISDIDNNLEAFTFGELLNPDTVVVHVEKANPEIRGLYTAINKLFLENEFPDVEFVNREEDLGLEGLRQAKLSYKPIKLVEKYTLIEK